MESDIPITAVTFSRNYGKESAMFAGLQKGGEVYGDRRCGSAAAFKHGQGDG